MVTKKKALRTAKRLSSESLAELLLGRGAIAQWLFLADKIGDFDAGLGFCTKTEAGELSIISKALDLEWEYRGKGCLIVPTQLAGILKRTLTTAFEFDSRYNYCVLESTKNIKKVYLVVISCSFVAIEN